MSGRALQPPWSPNTSAATVPITTPPVRRFRHHHLASNGGNPWQSGTATIRDRQIVAVPDCASRIALPDCARWLSRIARESWLSRIAVPVAVPDCARIVAVPDCGPGLRSRGLRSRIARVAAEDCADRVTAGCGGAFGGGMGAAGVGGLGDRTRGRGARFGSKLTAAGCPAAHPAAVTRRFACAQSAPTCHYFGRARMRVQVRRAQPRGRISPSASSLSSTCCTACAGVQSPASMRRSGASGSS